MPTPQSLFLRTDGSLRAGWKALLFLAADGLLNGYVRALLWKPSLPFLDSWLPQLWASVLIILLLTWLFLLLEGRPLGSVGLQLGWRWAAHCLVGMVAGFLLMIAVALAIRGLDGFHWEWTTDQGLRSGAWLFLAVALREELLFRGYAFQRLLEGTAEWFALGLASLYFVQAHWANPGMVGATRFWAALNIGLVGILLGLCYLKTQSLALPIGFHLGWNWAQGSLLGFGVSGIQLGSPLKPVFHGHPLWLTGGPFGPEASLPCTIFCGLAIAGLVLWKRREET